MVLKKAKLIKPKLNMYFNLKFLILSVFITIMKLEVCFAIAIN